MWDALTRREATTYFESRYSYLPELGRLPDSSRGKRAGVSPKVSQVDPNGATDQSRMLRHNLSFVKVESRRTTVATNFVAHLLRRRLAALQKQKADLV
jgi:hypothetical protein